MSSNKNGFKETELGILPNDWETEPIQKISDTITDFVANGGFASLRQNVKYKSKIDYAILIRLVDYKNNFQNNFVYINEHAYKYLKKTKLYGGEIIISNVGAYAGTVFRAPFLSIPMNLGPNSIMIKTKYSDDFYYYWFKSPIGNGKIKSILTGSAHPKFNKTDFRKLLVPIPPLIEQKAIAKVLSDIDDKIELNNEMNKTLEEIGQVLFKRWFIDFEFPDENGNPYKSSGGEMVYSEELEKEIPKGWEIVSYSKAVSYIFGFPFDSKLFNDKGQGFPIIRIRDLPKNKTNLFTSEKYDNKYLVNPGDFIIGMDGEFRPYVWKGEDVLLNQRIVKIIPKLTRSYIYYSSFNPLKYIENSKTGTTVIHLNKVDLDAINIILPSMEILNKFEKITLHTLDLEISTYLESLKLSEIRDALLPKLMSGEIRVSLEVTL